MHHGGAGRLQTRHVVTEGERELAGGVVLGWPTRADDHASMITGLASIPS